MLERQFVNWTVLFGSHYLYLSLRDYFAWDNLKATLILTAVIYEFFYFFPSFLFQWMDTTSMITEDRRSQMKLKTIKSKYGFWEMFPIVIRNHVIQYFLFCVAVYYLYDPSVVANESPISTFVMSVVSFVITDITLFAGHWFMHCNDAIYKYTHSLHHATFASQAISAHFMTVIDFAFESMIPMIISIYLFRWGASTVSLIAFAAAGAWNTTVVHSGYDFAFLADPTLHYVHHLKYFKNYSIGISDYLFQTTLTLDQVRQE
jgi:hypothetical protein